MIATQQHLKYQLDQQYELLCYVDLADVTKTPGDIYLLFKTHYKSAYQQHQRLVFYTNQRIPADLLQHIREACFTADISASFLLFCTNYDCSDELQQIFGNADYPMNMIVEVDCQILSSGYHYPETLCPLPFMHLNAMYQGEIKPCCINTDVISNVKTSTFKKAFNDPVMQTLRQEFLSGNKPKSCSHCWNIEDHSGESARQIYINTYKTQFLTEWIHNPKLQSLDIRAGNVCNFKCRICSPRASSAIASERLNLLSDQKEIATLKQILKEGQWFDDNSIGTLQEILELAPNLVSITFLGGEPFLLKSLNVLLEKLIETGHAKQIKTHFNSNGSIFPNHIIKNLSQFKKANICLSIDDIGHRFEYQRGGIWDEIEKNCKKYKLLDPEQFEFSIYPVINIQNVYYIDELLDWANDNQLLVISEYLDSPKWLSITQLTDDAKRLICKKFSNLQHPLIQSILKKIETSPGSTGTLFCKNMQEIDLRRKQKFSDHHNEIAIAMGYSV